MSMRTMARLSAGLLLALTLLPAQAQTVPPDKAIVVVRVPADAAVSIGDVPTTQKGAERQFITPPLPAGRNFYYVLKASWTENGQAKSETREVLVKAGARAVVDFTVPVAKAGPPPVPVEPEPKVVEPKEVGKPEPKAGEAKARAFLVTYAVSLTGLPPDKAARVWLPVPSRDEHQDIEIADTKALPAGFKIDKEPTYGNQILYTEANGDKEGKADLAVTYKVRRREVVGPSKPEIPDAPKLARYLEPDKLGPLDGKPLELIKGKAVPADQMAAARMLYDVVNGHVKYSKEGTGWGRGDVEWVCDSKTGNCTDFHSLFISLARANKIPAKFEMGLPLPAQRGEGEIGGYHCWAYFKPDGKGWVAVDISEANKDPKMTDYYFGNLTEDRVAFSTGRDYDLVPRQDGPTRNFLIYPYVELDGKELPAAQVKRKFTFKDLPN